ncbi:MAG: TIGR03862 family flavoprotein [Methylocystis sp.]|nr:TIGR03862 family flavoprotein [Methylocystis sp.]MCA3583302.1 TIGR03862 family flavoprotein [Methylocystis sp.]MCA3588087.1 TIGR03862 family flavoprotein [Methylocystis sp.]MCA3591471.1 TIGR03862 family flavoprotein [Methylocystis sp.]
MAGIAIIGGGPAGLAAAEKLAALGHGVTLYERMPSLGRKFLLAGRGGLNLTHSEPLAAFLTRYGSAGERLAPLIRAWDPAALRSWAEGLGEETFTGSSGRVFPRSFKTSPLLRAWLRRLADQGVTMRPGHRWEGWDETGALSFRTGDGAASAMPDATLLALGGASWPRLGSDASWVPFLTARGIAITPLRPSNMGFKVPWSLYFASRHTGSPLKRIALTFGDRSVRGEAMITDEGIEGGAIYALSAVIREAVATAGHAMLTIDLCPDAEARSLAERLAEPRKGESLANVLRKRLGLSPAQIGLLHEADRGAAALPPPDLAALIKAVPVTITGVQSIDRAISTAGGIALAELDDNLMLRKRPGVFAAGEMLDWEAPTGGYLLQACFATGIAAANGIDRYLR